MGPLADRSAEPSPTHTREEGSRIELLPLTREPIIQQRHQVATALLLPR